MEENAVTKILYKITNTLTNEIYIGSTQKTLKECLNDHIRSELFFSYVIQYGINILCIEEIKKIDESKSLEEKTKELLKHRLNNEKILNKYYGNTPIEYIEKIIKQFPDDSVENIYKKIKSKKPYNKKAINKQELIVFEVFDNGVYISCDSSIDKIASRFDDFEILGKFDYDKAQELCLDESIKYALKNVELKCNHAGIYKKSSLMRIINEFYVNLTFDVVKNELTNQKIYRIYKITNLINNKVYIGRTNKIARYRFLDHARAFSDLGKDMRKYGKKNFSIEILCYCNTKEEAEEKEIYFTRQFSNTYNKRENNDLIRFDQYNIYLLECNNESVVVVNDTKYDTSNLVRGTKLEKHYKTHRESNIKIIQIGSISKQAFEQFDLFHNEDLFNNLENFVSTQYHNLLHEVNQACKKCYDNTYSKILAKKNRSKGYTTYVVIDIALEKIHFVYYDRSLIKIIEHASKILSKNLTSSNCIVTILGKDLSYEEAKQICIKRQLDWLEKNRLCGKIFTYDLKTVNEMLRYILRSEFEKEIVKDIANVSKLYSERVTRN